MVFGSWYKHITGWWEKKRAASNILYLFYEDLTEVGVGSLHVWDDENEHNIHNKFALAGY